MTRNQDRYSSRAHARVYAMRLLYQREMTAESIDRILQSGSWQVENRMSAECVCPYTDECKPHLYYEQFGDWPEDYECPWESLPPIERSAKCRRSKVCRCRRYYKEHKECPPKNYPFVDGDYSVDKCKCVHYKSCEYREFFDSFAVAPDGYACELARGVERELSEIDKLVEATSENWAVFRMPVVDRNILRIAVYEIVFDDDIPTSVAINEAVSIAKEYGGDDSSKFINGVLGKIAKMIDEESE